jgi:hypothetical protein
MIPLLAAAVGLIAGIHTATWGMYKDAPHEGFSGWKYARSIVLATVIAVVIAGGWGLDPRRAADLVVLFGATYAVERALAEIYKTFLREEDQSKYFIPMQFSVFGQVVRSRSARCLGILILAIAIERAAPNPTPIGTVLAIGGLGGWISAFGGAWKDAPKEGFQTLKFFRSPFIATVYAVLLSRLTDDIVLMALGALGYTIATTETYKTFFFPSKPRGKFAGMPVLYPDMLRKRQPFIALYAAIWLVVIVAWVMAAR